MATKSPDAFLSYTHFDDQYHGGAIGRFSDRLSMAVRAITAKPFEIFRDIDGIELGENWRERLNIVLGETRFFIPILTPNYFESKACRDELARFLEFEKQCGRHDLILPIHYIDCAVLEDPKLRSGDPLAMEIDGRQRYDWRKLRNKPFGNTAVRTELERLAHQIHRARLRPMSEMRTPQLTTEAARPEQTLTLPLTPRGVGSDTGVEYAGIKFRSPVQARWGIFFHTIGLKYQYLSVDVDDVRHESSFWLSELSFWFEVKDREPTEQEKNLCQRLADKSNHVVLMAIGAPEPRDQILIFPPSTSTRFHFLGHGESRFYFADDRRNEGEFWLLSSTGAASSIGPRTGPDHGKYPGLYGATLRGYEAAGKLRFEHHEIVGAPVYVSPDHVEVEGLLFQPIDKETLEIYTLWKYPNLPVDHKIQQMLIRDLDKTRYKTLGDLDRVVYATSDAVERYKNMMPEMFGTGTDYLTKSLGFADDKFRKQHPFSPRTRAAFEEWGHLVRLSR
jgi:hypothetical protein